MATNPEQNLKHGMKCFPVTPRKLEEPKFNGVDFDGTDAVDVFNYAVQKFKAVIKDKTASPMLKARAKAWLGYAYAIAHSERWDFNPDQKNREEDEWLESELLGAARDLVKQATGDPQGTRHFDTHWAKAAAYMYLARNTKDWNTAEGAYLEAEKLARGKKTILRDLHYEMADFYTHRNNTGDLDEAIRLCKAEKPAYDWHRHQEAWCQFLEARNLANDNEKQKKYAAAIKTLKSMKPDCQDTHLCVSMLLKTACHHERAKFLSGWERQEEEALAWGSLEQFRHHTCFKKWTRENFTKYAPFRKQADRRYWQGLWRELKCA